MNLLVWAKRPIYKTIVLITRSPLRLTLGGGGTDLPSYYEKHGGFCLGVAINKYVFITLHENFTPGLVVKYSETEKVACAAELKHPLVREAFALLGMDGAGLEICAFADIPAGTGLGSSSAFTCALLRALHAYRHDQVSPEKLAEEACRVEIERCKDPIGKQDQYLSALGGLTCLRFSHQKIVTPWPLPVSPEIRRALQENLLLFFTGYSRSASSILREQDEKSRARDADMTANLDFIKAHGITAGHLLMAGRLKEFGAGLHEHWQHKKARSSGISNADIDRWYDRALAAGALGGKLIGAGGGGFLMFYTTDRAQLRAAMAAEGLREVHFLFDEEGTKLL